MHPCIRLCTHEFIHALINSFIYLSKNSSIYPSTHPSIHPSNHPFIYPSISPLIHASIHPFHPPINPFPSFCCYWNQHALKEINTLHTKHSILIKLSCRLKLPKHTKKLHNKNNKIVYYINKINYIYIIYINIIYYIS